MFERPLKPADQAIITQQPFQFERHQCAAKLSIKMGKERFALIRLWQDGLSIKASLLPKIRGVVSLYNRDEHMMECLIMPAYITGDELVCSFKRKTFVQNAPDVDFYRIEGA